MKIKVEFGKITVNGEEYTKDIVIKKGKIEKRRKKESKELKEKGEHTPLTNKEDIPWKCKTLIIGSGFEGALPVHEKVYKKAEELNVELKIMKTPEAVDYINSLDDLKDTNAILHITC
jgi:hypothetical protein